jgi:hypothetical protein
MQFRYGKGRQQGLEFGWQSLPQKRDPCSVASPRVVYTPANTHNHLKWLVSYISEITA